MTQDLLDKLRDPADDGPLAELCQLILADLLGQPLSDVVEPKQTAGIVADVLEQWLASDTGEARLLEGWREGVERLGKESRNLGELAPPELKLALAELLEQPFSPEPALLRRLVDREPIRDLLRDILYEALIGFGRKVSSPVAASGLGKGLAERARSGLGGGLFGKAGGLASLAEGMVGAVSHEVERRLEGGAAEFADNGISGVVQRLVDHLANPDQAAEQATLRLSMLDGAWELTGAEAATELRKLDPERTAKVLRRALGAWTGRDDFRPQVQGWIEQLVDEAGDLSLRAVLEDLDLLSSFEKHGSDLLHQRARSFVGGGAFAAWLGKLTS